MHKIRGNPFGFVPTSKDVRTRTASAIGRYIPYLSPISDLATGLPAPAANRSE